MREGWLPHRTHALQPVTRNLTHTLGWAGWDPELINNFDSNPELSNELYSIFKGKMQEAIQEGARFALLHLRHRRHPVPISHPPPAPSVDPARLGGAPEDQAEEEEEVEEEKEELYRSFICD